MLLIDIASRPSQHDTMFFIVIHWPEHKISLPAYIQNYKSLVDERIYASNTRLRLEDKI